jgi:2-polyprenyl-3-methyl-5-hydroxy-6-metoxy-1,4-benzoquinol methylase
MTNYGDAVADRLFDPDARALHWNSIYERLGPRAVSWYQPEPLISVAIMETLGVSRDDGVIDVGAGASTLVDVLVAQGFTDVTVLDISATAIGQSRRRLGEDAPVTWIETDLLTWAPTRRYDVWHDRAVLHFLSAPEVDTYREVMRRALAPGGLAIVATFALDGPSTCSGLPVTRYDADQLASALGEDFDVLERRREVHSTPMGGAQPFTWVAARRVRD